VGPVAYKIFGTLFEKKKNGKLGTKVNMYLELGNGANYEFYKKLKKIPQSSENPEKNNNFF
jgi:hypothetical protein